ncbi:hypothetical protein [Nocardiopsis alba]|uniref:hypothetical protein n=1 Tax=Nocardiopsis alba TaxID=53437 RepID=UPI0011D21A5A|nr:hypothetical protein [Nocardiopsis alba]
MDSTSQKLLNALRGNYEAQRESDQRTQEAAAKAKAAEEREIRLRASELREHGYSLQGAHQKASQEVRAKKLAEAAKADRARVDEAIRAIEARDREATSADTLRERLRKLASTPADHDARVAEAKQRQRIEREAAENDS